MRTLCLALSVTLMSACAAPAPQQDFIQNLSTLCGQSFAGNVVSDDAVDADWRAADIVMGPVACEVAGFKIPLRVGENTSRTWMISSDKSSMTLKHDHRHDDGSPDAVTFYGGTTADNGTANRQEFPVDDYSIDLFKREDLSASVTNIWAVEIKPGDRFAYELSRPRTDAQIKAGDTRGRFFRIEFDVSEPLTP